MTGASCGADIDLAAWIAKHQVSWEVAAVQELVKGLGVQQTGYALKLSGRFDATAQDDDEAVARAIYERLRALALDALRSLPVHALIQVQPASQAALPGEDGFILEVELTVVGSPAHPDQPPAPAEVRRLIGQLEARLRSMGLHKRR